MDEQEDIREDDTATAVVEQGEPETEETAEESSEEQDAAEATPEPQAETLESNPEADQLNRIRELEYQVDSAESDWEEAKQHAKECKERFEYKVKKLREAIRGITRRLPLFDQIAKPAGWEPPATELQPDDQPEDPELWRKATLEELGITGKLAETLTEQGFTTLGDITDHTSADKRLTDIKGIGEAKAAQIEEALTKYWETHPQTTVTEDPYTEGKEAAAAGIPSMDNPYEVDTPERESWNAGWNDSTAEKAES